MEKSYIISILVAIAIFSFFCIVLWFSVNNGGQTSLLTKLYYSSGTIYNESTSEIINNTTSINLSEYIVITNWSEIPKFPENLTSLIWHFRSIGGVHESFSFKFIIKSNQPIYYKNTEFNNTFVFILFGHTDGRIQFVSGLALPKRDGWHKDDPNFHEHKKLAHQKALQNTQEILDVLNLHPKGEISFKEVYI